MLATCPAYMPVGAAEILDSPDEGWAGFVYSLQVLLSAFRASNLLLRLLSHGSVDVELLVAIRTAQIVKWHEIPPYSI
jgi:hypothetical protein